MRKKRNAIRLSDLDLSKLSPAHRAQIEGETPKAKRKPELEGHTVSWYSPVLQKRVSGQAIIPGKSKAQAIAQMKVMIAYSKQPKDVKPVNFLAHPVYKNPNMKKKNGLFESAAKAVKRARARSKAARALKSELRLKSKASRARSKREKAEREAMQNPKGAKRPNTSRTAKTRKNISVKGVKKAAKRAVKKASPVVRKLGRKVKAAARAFTKTNPQQRRAVANVLRKHGIKPNPPIISDIIGGAAGGAGYATAAYLVAKQLGNRKRKKTNPKPAKAPRAINNLHIRFQGRDSKHKPAHIPASQHVPASVAQLGKLVELKVNGKTIKGFSDRARLVADQNNKLHIVGVQFNPPTEISNPSELALIGKLQSVTYQTRKNHLHNGGTFNFVHKLGEEGGALPSFLLDHTGRPVIKGGSYKIQRVGIRD